MTSFGVKEGQTLMRPWSNTAACLSVVVLLCCFATRAQAYIDGDFENVREFWKHVRCKAYYLRDASNAILPAIRDKDAWAYAAATAVYGMEWEARYATNDIHAEAHANADAWFGHTRRAAADADANKVSGPGTATVTTDADADRHCGAFAIGGIGWGFAYDSDNPAVLVIGALLEAALDPISPEWSDSNFPSFIYAAELTDPFGETSSLLEVKCEMVYDEYLEDYTLLIDDPTGTLMLEDFSRTDDPDGRVTFTLIDPVEFVIPFSIPDSWPDGALFDVDTKLTGQVGTPEPATIALLGLGALVLLRRHRT